MGKYLTRNNLMGERFLWLMVYVVYGLQHHGREDMTAGAAHICGRGSLLTSEQIRKQREKGVPAISWLSPFPYFFFRIPAHEEMPPTFRVGLSSSVKPFWKCLHRHMLQMCLLSDSKSSQVDPED